MPLPLVAAALCAAAVVAPAGPAALNAPLRACSGRQPWLTEGAFATRFIEALADEVSALRLSTLAQVRGFSGCVGFDDRFATSPTLAFCARREACTGLADDATLADGHRELAEPFASRIITAGDEGKPLAQRRWEAAITEATGRPLEDADVYVTNGRGATSASFGWHIDDIDVLLVLLRGRKRFRVAGATVGSTPVIDHVMAPGDAIFVPAGAFHTGGQSEPSDSMLLSVAFLWSNEHDEYAASKHTERWMDVRKHVLANWLPAERDSWSWAGSAGGREALRARFTSHCGGDLGNTSPFMPARSRF